MISENYDLGIDEIKLELFQGKYNY